MPAVLRLAVPVPLRRLFDYTPPDDVNPRDLRPGQRLRVPFGSRELTAVLTDIADSSEFDADQLRPASALLDQAPLVSESVQQLCLWAANHYQHPVGDVFSAALPKLLREGRDLPQDGWRLTTRGLGLADGALARARSQAKAIALLQAAPRSGTDLADAGVSAAVLRELVRKDLIERCTLEAGPLDTSTREAGPVLLAEQSAAVDAVNLGRFGCHLLQGITGSGKTEVYLQLIARCLGEGRQALVLIPEIGLTPQTVARFEARFQTSIAVLHSGLGDGQRLAAWQAARSGQAGIVMGTRSAVFTTLANPGLIIVDEEHDGSYKQQDGFRYAARDVAVKRAQLEGCPVVLGSATPSLESLLNAHRGRYQVHHLNERPGSAALPRLETIDLRRQPLQGGMTETLLSAVRQTVQIDGHQALLFLNRRGYAPTLQCHSCGWVADCDHCDARMTVHLRDRRLRCHHCTAQRPLPGQCPDCGSSSLLTRGLGTEQAEEQLRQLLPCPVHRVDSDALRTREAMSSLLDIARAGEPCVILGTQMLTKGHHFPAVQLVGVMDADALLYSADFRGEERMAQLITQVSGRAGRERSGGRVLIQTHYPDDPLFAALQRNDYSALGAALLQRRQATGMPPFGQLLLLRADARDERLGEQFLVSLKKQVLPTLDPACRLLGPLPSAMPRRAGRFRWQLWCMAPSRSTAHRAAQQLVQAGEALGPRRDLGWFVDVDPQDVL